MVTDADRWVAAQLARPDRHPDWPADGAALVTEEPGRVWGQRWDGWIVRRIGQPIPEPLGHRIPEPPAAAGPWLRWKAGPPLNATITTRVWALRADVPGEDDFWWELQWQPGPDPPEMTPYGSSRVTVDRAHAYFAAGLDLLRGVGQGLESEELFLERLERAMRALYEGQYQGRRRGPYRLLTLGDVAAQHGNDRAYLHELFKTRYGLRWSAHLKPWTPDSGETLTAFARRARGRAVGDDPTQPDSAGAETDA